MKIPRLNLYSIGGFSCSEHKNNVICGRCGFPKAKPV